MVSDEVGNEFFFDSLDCLSPERPVEIEDKFECDFDKFGYRIWLNEPRSVNERRQSFLRDMGLCESVSESVDISVADGIGERSGAVSSSLLSCTVRVEQDLGCGCSCREAYCEAKSMVEDDLGRDQFDEYNVAYEDVNSGSPFSVEECEGRDWRNASYRKKKMKNWWKRFVSRRKEIEEKCLHGVSNLNHGNMKGNRTKVKNNKKRCMEFTGICIDQEIRAHKGLIWTMKFSPDGQYLATGGEDGIVHIWHVTYVDASFKNLDVDGNFSKQNNSHVSIAIPEQVFSIEDSPLQELHGHTSDVLDLAWSPSNLLLSSSKDKTVRMWQVGCDSCLNVFQHNDYVTCIQFNPIDENYFLSGSIDGKVRIWGVPERRVFNWVDVRNVISAICYKPDGKGLVVGSVTGTCRFYEDSGNDLQLEAEIYMRRAKTNFGNGITGIQFLVASSQCVVITSEDSKVRVFDGLDLVRKFKGLPNSGSQMSASMTSTGRHLISVGQDSRVYIWNYNDSHTKSASRQVKSMRSCEHFLSKDITVAIPWPGTTGKTPNDIHCSFSCGQAEERSTGIWPEEKLPPLCDIGQRRPICSSDLKNLSEAWGLVIVTAARDGTIRTFHNYGLPIRI